MRDTRESVVCVRVKCACEVCECAFTTSSDTTAHFHNFTNIQLKTCEFGDVERLVVLPIKDPAPPPKKKNNSSKLTCL